jgi:hypothetical protein
MHLYIKGLAFYNIDSRFNKNGKANSPPSNYFLEHHFDSLLKYEGCLSPGHTALYGLITAKARQNVISHKADKIK